MKKEAFGNILGKRENAGNHLMVPKLTRLINLFPNKSGFLRVCSTSLLKTLGKGEIAHNEQFLLFPQCFQPFWRTIPHFHQT